MPDNSKNLYYLQELPDYKVATGYTDVRGWEVEDAEKKMIGVVDGLLVNKEAERVVYLDVELDPFIIQQKRERNNVTGSEDAGKFINKEGEDHILIPVGIVSIDEEENKVRTEVIDRSTFAGIRRFRKGSDIDRNYEREVLVGYFPSLPPDQLNVPNREFYNRKEFSFPGRRIEP